jgi:hypothetical protein
LDGETEQLRKLSKRFTFLESVPNSVQRQELIYFRKQVQCMLQRFVIYASYPQVVGPPSVFIYIEHVLVLFWIVL